VNLTTVGGNALRAAPAAWRRGAAGRHRRRAMALVPRLLATIGDPAERWVAGPPLVSSTRTAVVPLGPPGCPPVAVAKLPGTRVGVTSQQREGRALDLGAGAGRDMWERERGGPRPEPAGSAARRSRGL